MATHGYPVQGRGGKCGVWSAGGRGITLGPSMPAAPPSSPRPSAASLPPRAAPAAARGFVLAEIALVFVVFATYAAWPVPDVNEAHYLTKARHFWDPAWVAGDFFLDSAD